MAAKDDSERMRSLREIVRNKFTVDVLKSAGGTACPATIFFSFLSFSNSFHSFETEKSAGAMVLVLDDESTRVISSVLTMYDIMEERVTLVEQLVKNRQPFREMDVIYLVSPTVEAATRIVEDFPSENKAKYGGVHIYFLDVVCTFSSSSSLLTPYQVSDEVTRTIQASSLLCQKIKTFKELNLHFVTSESNVFHFDMHSSLTRLYGEPTDPVCPIQIAQKLATLCITLNEFPSIKYQISSAYATTIATTTLNILENFKRTNSNFWSHGDDGRQDRERGILLIVDRSFDPLSPLMHEFTYQAMVNDLLPVKDGIISIVAETNSGAKVEKKAILNEADEYWVSLRHQHIASVIDYMKERMSDIITNNPSAALAKKSGADMSVTAMAAAVKALPEYRETTAKLSQHVSITQKCMDVFTVNNLLEIHALEEKMSTGEDDDGKQVKQPDLLKQLIDMLIMPDVSQQIKIRLLSIFFLTRGATATAEERRRLIQAANLTGPEQQILLNFERGLGATLLQSTNTRAASGQSGGGILSMFKRKFQAKHEPTPEGQYTESRHKCRLKGILESLMGAEGSEALPNDLFASIGPFPAAKNDQTKFAKNSNRSMYQSSRYIVCIAGGVASSELRTAYELMGTLGKEVIIGGTHLINPNIYLKDVASLNTRSADASRLFEIEFPNDDAS